MIRVSLVLPLLVLSACGHGKAIDYLRMKNISPPTLNHFIHCYDYGCNKRVTAALAPEAQKQLNALLQTKPASAEEERAKIAQAIAVFEQSVGAALGTDKDKKGTFLIYEEKDNKKYDTRFQQDCVDETINTTTYLMLLDQMGLMHYHTPVFPANRYPSVNNHWWHQTATMIEDESSAHYVVDSWFHDNGQAAEILPVSVWKDGWKPSEN